MKAEQIPDDAWVELALRLESCGVIVTKQQACLAITAAINAWPEAKRVKGYFTHDTDYYEPAFILPLPQEGDA